MVRACDDGLLGLVDLRDLRVGLRLGGGQILVGIDVCRVVGARRGRQVGGVEGAQRLAGGDGRADRDIHGGDRARHGEVRVTSRASAIEPLALIVLLTVPCCTVPVNCVAVALALVAEKGLNTRMPAMTRAATITRASPPLMSARRGIFMPECSPAPDKCDVGSGYESAESRGLTRARSSCANWRAVWSKLAPGTVSERPKEHVSKTCDGASHPWVQIPPVPRLKSPRDPRDFGGFFARAVGPPSAHS